MEERVKFNLGKDERNAGKRLFRRKGKEIKGRKVKSER